MRIAVINELIECGGTEIQTAREVNNFRNHGDEVLHITLDDNCQLINDDLRCNIPLNWNRKKVAKGKLISDRWLHEKLSAVLNNFSPDVVHVNNIVRAPFSVYKAVEPYKAVLTIRDYSAVCPKGTNIRNDYSSCEKRSLRDCLTCSGSVWGLLKVPYFFYKTHRRNKAFNKIVSPSEELARFYTLRVAEAICINNPFEGFGYCTEKQIKDVKRFLYYGSIERKKGVVNLIEAWKVFSNNKNDVELCFAGKVDAKFEEYFNTSINDMNSIKYLGWLNQEEISALFTETYCVVVPSLWMENYPNTVLESIAHKTLVIGSNRGGIPELIKKETLLFDAVDFRSLCATLDHVYQLQKNEYIHIVNSAFDAIKMNNDLETYYIKMSNLYEVLLNRD